MAAAPAALVEDAPAATEEAIEETREATELLARPVVVETAPVGLTVLTLVTPLLVMVVIT